MSRFQDRCKTYMDKHPKDARMFLNASEVRTSLKVFNLNIFRKWLNVNEYFKALEEDISFKKIIFLSFCVFCFVSVSRFFFTTLRCDLQAQKINKYSSRDLTSLSIFNGHEQ